MFITVSHFLTYLLRNFFPSKESGFASTLLHETLSSNSLWCNNFNFIQLRVNYKVTENQLPTLWVTRTFWNDMHFILYMGCGKIDYQLKKYRLYRLNRVNSLYLPYQNIKEAPVRSGKICIGALHHSKVHGTFNKKSGFFFTSRITVSSQRRHGNTIISQDILPNPCKFMPPLPSSSSFINHRQVWVMIS